MTTLQQTAPPLPRRITLVEDDKAYAGYLAEYLQARGCEVQHFGSAEAMLASRAAAADMYIVDLMLPGADGLDLVGAIRARAPASGVLIVSGRLGPDNFNSGLAAGADMYLSKPVRFDQIVYALNSIQRRFSTRASLGQPWKLVLSVRKLIDPEGRSVRVTMMEMQLLQVLAKTPGTPVSRSALVERIGKRSHDSVRNVDAAFYRLRSKIEAASSASVPFRSAHRQGYGLNARLEILD